MDGFFVVGFLYNPKTKSVLLQKRDMKAEFNPGLWSFFGGSSENNETPEQCLVRELKKSEMVLNEGEDFDWIPLTKVLELNLTENTRKSLEVLIERIGQK